MFTNAIIKLNQTDYESTAEHRKFVNSFKDPNFRTFKLMPLSVEFLLGK